MSSSSETRRNFALVLDSSKRDLSRYPSPGRYSVQLPRRYKDVTKLTVEKAKLPYPTSKNVTKNNNVIPFNVYPFVTRIILLDNGYGCQDGDYPLNIPAPDISTNGVQAEGQVRISGGNVWDTPLDVGGNGYLYREYDLVVENVPFIDDSDKDNRHPIVRIVFGHRYYAELKTGKYDLSVRNDSSPGFCREITESLRRPIIERYDDSAADQSFPYGGGLDNEGSCQLVSKGDNFVGDNFVNIQNGRPASGSPTQVLYFVELLWGSCGEEYKSRLASGLLGFKSGVNVNTGLTSPGNSDHGSWVSSSRIVSDYECALDESKDVVMSITNLQMDGMHSNNSAIDNSFAVFSYDSSKENVEAYDFGKREQGFPNPLGFLERLDVRFTDTLGEEQDFEGRDHLIVLGVETKMRKC